MWTYVSEILVSLVAKDGKLLGYFTKKGVSEILVSLEGEKNPIFYLNSHNVSEILVSLEVFFVLHFHAVILSIFCTFYRFPWVISAIFNHFWNRQLF